MSEQIQLGKEVHDDLPPLPEAVSVGGSAGIAAKLRRAITAGEYGFNERQIGRAHV